MSDTQDNGHHHGHDHAQGHRHPFQPDLEDADYSYYQVMTEAVIELLVGKKLITAEELRTTIETIDSKSPVFGARLIARAWVDPVFKARMLEDVITAAGELGIDAGAIPIKAVENTATVHNVIVCTLCSCYPRSLIGLPPDWYKARAYRSRVVREPRAVLKEFGTQIAADMEVRVHDSTADLRYMVLPARPVGTDDMDEEALADLVTRDCMIGTALPRSA